MEKASESESEFDRMKSEGDRGVISQREGGIEMELNGEER
jgi:hypothetical protein